LHPGFSATREKTYPDSGNLYWHTHQIIFILSRSSANGNGQPVTGAADAGIFYANDWENVKPIDAG
jgi:hypothetical protein